MKKIAQLTFFALATAFSLPAQNSDLGFLFGLATRDLTIRNGVTRGEVRVSFQVNYAWQLVEGKGGRLYFELPALFAAGASGELSPQIVGRAGGITFLTPGLRYHYNVSPRVAVYVAAGAGFAAKAEEYGIVGNSVRSTTQTSTGGAYNFGGGLDFRLTRLWSLRGEVRNFRTTRETALSGPNTMVQLGFALHF